MDSWTPQQIITSSIALLGALIAFLSWRASKDSADAAKKSAAAAEIGNKEAQRSADAAERSAAAAEKQVERSVEEREEKKVETLADHLQRGGGNFHQEVTGNLVRKLEDDPRRQQQLVVDAHALAGHTDHRNLHYRLTLLGLTDEQLDRAVDS